MEDRALEPFFLRNESFNRIGSVPKSAIDEYKNLVPNEIIELWNQGSGSYMNDFFWIINPQEFGGLIEEVYKPFGIHQ